MALTALQRQQALRDRQRRGVALAQDVEYGPDDIENLIALGLLPDAKADDPRAVGRAISVALGGLWLVIAQVGDSGSPLTREMAPRAFRNAVERAKQSQKKMLRRDTGPHRRVAS